MKGTHRIARKEFFQHFYNRRFYILGTLLLATMLLGTVLLPWFAYEDFSRYSDPSDPHYEEARQEFSPGSLFGIYLSLPLLGGLALTQLLAIILTSDAVCSEWQRRTLFLLLSKPITRSGFILGKFFGTFTTLAAFLVPLATLSFVVMHFVFDFSFDGERTARFFLGLVVLLLGAGVFTAFSILTSSITRTTTMSMLTALGAWLLVFPLLGMVGYFGTIGDDEFNSAGQLDWEGAYKDCGDNPRYWHEPGTENVTDEQKEWEACQEKWQQKVEDWYIAKGLDPFDSEAERKACFDAHPEGTKLQACMEEVNAREEAYREKRQAIFAAKWDSPRVDWSRYLSPSTVMSITPELVAPDATHLTSEMFFGVDVSPASRMGAIAAMLGQTVLFLGLSILVVRRRDFH